MIGRVRYVAAILAVLMLATACGGAASSSTTQAAAGGKTTASTTTKSSSSSSSSSGTTASANCPNTSHKTLKFADNQFQTLWINNAIAEYIIQHGFCVPAKSVTLSTPVAQKAIASDQVQIWMELWRVNIIKWYNQVTSSGKLVDLGNTYNTSTQGWYVPYYVIHGDAARGIKATAPNLKSVADLAKYWQVFKDPNNPSKGVLVNCIGSWQCNKVNRIKLHAYGLDKYYTTEDPGTPAALDAAIVGAYKKGQPVLAYYWGPTWLLGQYKMVQLKEPAFTNACNAELQKVLTGEIPVNKAPKSAGCAYKSFAIHKGVNASVVKGDPQVTAFLKKMNVGNPQLDATAAYMQTHKATAAQAAVWYFEHYTKRWESWLPSNVAARVRQALIKQGAKISG